MEMRCKLVGLMMIVALAGWMSACAVQGDEAWPDEEAVGEQEHELGGPPMESALEEADSLTGDRAEAVEEDEEKLLMCSGYDTCYCLCRWNNRCDQNPSECDPLADCLNGCDAQYPGCPTPGGGFPNSPADCF
jgi:hypothetical protein